MNEEQVLMRQILEDARKQFRSRCRKVLFEAYADSERLSTAVGDVSVDEAYEAWLKNLMAIARREG